MQSKDILCKNRKKKTVFYYRWYRAESVVYGQYIRYYGDTYYIYNLRIKILVEMSPLKQNSIMKPMKTIPLSTSVQSQETRSPNVYQISGRQKFKWRKRSFWWAVIETQCIKMHFSNHKLHCNKHSNVIYHRLKWIGKQLLKVRRFPTTVFNLRWRPRVSSPWCTLCKK